MQRDVKILRELAKRLREIYSNDIQERRRDLWRRHNNFERAPAPVYVRGGNWELELIAPELVCEDPFYRGHEYAMRFLIFQDGIGDDYIIEPWITQRASLVLPEGGHWGVPWNVTRASGENKGFHCNPAMESLNEIWRLTTPSHKVDETKTAGDVNKISEAVGDIVEVNVDRSPAWQAWSADLSTDLGYLRGQENVMWDIMDSPGELRSLLAFMRDGILKAQGEAEKAGDFKLSNHENQSMPYAAHLKDPVANGVPVMRNELWVFCAAQEFAAVSPEHHEEFMLEYQIPIIEKFALSSYGCCEDLSKKIRMLRRIKNLRRIAVSPFADVRKCAEQIGEDYICSYRPNPAATVCVGFDEGAVYESLCKDLSIFAEHKCFVDICLKDVNTVEGDPERLKGFARAARRAAERYA